MRSVRQQGTATEEKLGQALHRLGFRYKKSPKGLPGRPDFIFPKFRAAVFVHDCYSHRHGCRRRTTPKTNRDFWLDKFKANITRDFPKAAELREIGWQVATVWECPILDGDTDSFGRLVTRREGWITSTESELEFPEDREV